MKKYVLFGVKTQDIEVAREWIEEVIGVAAKGFTNDYVGDYYLFNPFGPTEEIELCSGVSEDEGGKYPTEPDFASWKIIVRLSKAVDGSPFLVALEAHPDKFQKLKTAEF